MRLSSKSGLAATAIFLLTTPLAGVCAEAQNPLLRDPIALWIGGFFPEINSKITLDSDIGLPGDGLDFEDVLGMDDSKSVLWGGARWRISQRNLIEFEYNRLNRRGFLAATTNEFTIGDSVVQAGGAIDSRFDVGLARLTYGFSLVKTPKNEVVAKGGLHIANLKVALQLSGNISIDGDPVSPVPAETPVIEDSDLTAPLPHFGFSYAHIFTPALAFRANLLGFYVEINDIEGSILDLGADLIYRPWKHVGIGAGVRFFRVSVDDKRSEKMVRPKFEFDYLGPTVYTMVLF